MTYPLRQRTFHEILYYLHNVRVHCCAIRAVKHQSRQLINKYHQRYICNELTRESILRQVKQFDISAALPLPPPLCLFLSDYVSVSFIAKPHRNFQNAHVFCFFLRSSSSYAIHTLTYIHMGSFQILCCQTYIKRKIHTVSFGLQKEISSV